MTDNIQTPAGSGSDPFIRTKHTGSAGATDPHEQYVRAKLYGTDDNALVALPNQTTTATTSPVACLAAEFTIFNANSNRKAASISNTTGAFTYVKFGTGASSTSHKVTLATGEYYEFPQPCYTGVVTGRSVSASGSLYVSEEV